MIIALGLLLVFCSVFEITQVRRYRSDVQEVRRMLLEWDRLQAPQHGVRLQAPSMESILSPLDGAITLERSWWVVGAIGAVVAIAGFVGICVQQRTDTANKSLQATATAPGS
jgi:hypothetical protein